MTNDELPTVVFSRKLEMLALSTPELFIAIIETLYIILFQISYD
jgi:hypothetical protein